MAKKVEIITKEGRIIRVMPHTLDTMAMFGASQKRPEIRNVPKELLDIPSDISKKTVISKTDVLPPMETTQEPQKRKLPVRSKSKK